jgi:ParB/RepB/Spo0J family partition protein
MPAKHVLGDVCDVVRRSDIFHIDPDHINVVDGWNPRTDFEGEADLVASIKERGVMEPLLVRKTKGKQLELIAGERRLRASLRARAEGADIKSVPVIVAKRGTNDADLFADAILENSGKPFTPTEESAAFRRLANWGYDAKMIAARSGKSVSHVRNRLQLAAASPDVKAAVDAGEITVGQATTIAKNSDGKIDDQKNELKKAKTKPKARKLVLSFKKGDLRETGFKGGTCEPFRKLLLDPEFMQAIHHAGFNAESIRITIDPTKVEPKPLWEQEPDEDGRYCCPECGIKVDAPDLCPDCYKAAEAEHKKNAVPKRAGLNAD